MGQKKIFIVVIASFRKSCCCFVLGERLWDSVWQRWNVVECCIYLKVKLIYNEMSEVSLWLCANALLDRLQLGMDWFLFAFRLEIVLFKEGRAIFLLILTFYPLVETWDSKCFLEIEQSILKEFGVKLRKDLASPPVKRESLKTHFQWGLSAGLFLMRSVAKALSS